MEPEEREGADAGLHTALRVPTKDWVALATLVPAAVEGVGVFQAEKVFGVARRQTAAPCNESPLRLSKEE